MTTDSGKRNLLYEGARHYTHQFSEPEPSDAFEAVTPVSGSPFELVLHLRNGDLHSIPYMLMGVKHLLHNGVIQINVSDSTISQVIIEGRNLRPIFDPLCQHTVKWVKEADNATISGSGDMPVISQIGFRESPSI